MVKCASIGRVLKHAVDTEREVNQMSLVVAAVNTVSREFSSLKVRRHQNDACMHGKFCFSTRLGGCKVQRFDVMRCGARGQADGASGCGCRYRISQILQPQGGGPEGCELQVEPVVYASRMCTPGPVRSLSGKLQQLALAVVAGIEDSRGRPCSTFRRFLLCNRSKAND